VTVAEVADVTLTDNGMTPVPEIDTEVLFMSKFDPVRLTATVAPCGPLLGLIFVSATD
jgi:hypothetical protein